MPLINNWTQISVSLWTFLEDMFLMLILTPAVTCNFQKESSERLRGDGALWAGGTSPYQTVVLKITQEGRLFLLGSHIEPFSKLDYHRERGNRY